MKYSWRLNQNRFIAIASAATLAAAAFPVLAEESKASNIQGQPGYQMGSGMTGCYDICPGMMSDYGMKHGMMGGGMGLYESLDLTTEQRAGIYKIQDETRQVHWAMMGEMMSQQSELRNLFMAPKKDSASIEKINKIYRQLGQMQQKMYETSVDAHQRIEEMLAKEQIEKLSNYSRWGGR